ncbi:MAG: hypothetical protein EA370_15870 [Wenzhouxiangella sp.]|nr:MAG: hypothetical protein EA370_15870 [Wenzhouxiangella sp.]
MSEARAARPWLALLAGAGYGLFYLYAIGDVTLYGPPHWGAYLTEVSLERIFTARSTLMFEAIAVIELGWVVWLFSPLNLFLALILAGLLAANMHGVLYIRAHPKQCQVGGNKAFIGALPALFAGGACCAPSLILLLGIPGLGAFGALFGWLLPISIVVLGINRIWQHGHGAPSMLEYARQRFGLNNPSTA